MLTLFGLLLPGSRQVSAGAYDNWQRGGCPWNNCPNGDWYAAEDDATRLVAHQLYERRGRPFGSDNENWTFAQLLVRTVLLAEQAWKACGGRDGAEGPPMGGVNHFLHALGFHLTNTWKGAMDMSHAPGWTLPEEGDTSGVTTLRDRLAFRIWVNQGQLHGFDLCHSGLAQWLIDLCRHTQRRTWLSDMPAETSCREACFMTTLVAFFLHDPSRTATVIGNANRAAAAAHFVN